MPAGDRDCQMTLPRSFSSLSRPRVLFKIHRLFLYLRRDGPRWTLNHALGALRRMARRPVARKPPPLRPDEVLGLQPGEWVEVKSEREIQETLGANGKTRGLAFLPEMREYCGRRVRVYKRLERIFLEESQQNRSLKNTVLLSGVVCSGRGYGCDRSCLYYWREAWLRRVPSNAAESGSR